MAPRRVTAALAVNASRGGLARASSMTADERRESARRAAEARWAGSSLLPKETHVGNLKIVPGLEIPCGIVDAHGKNIRVLSNRGVGRAFGSPTTGVRSGALKIPPFLTSPAISPFIPEDLMVRLTSPIVYRPKHGGRSAFGYEATLLPQICGVIIDANAAKPLKQNQLVRTANALLRAFAGVGIIALVDEATGFQAERVHDELQQILQAYVVEEMRKWIGVFPIDFFRQIYRLQGWKFQEGCAQRPLYIGKLINEWIYKRLPSPVLPKLRELNPVVDGRRRYRHHQFLTEGTGIPHLEQQIASVTTLMRASTDKRTFERLLVNAFPRLGEQMNLVAD